MDLTTVLIQVYTDYSLEQIQESKNNIRDAFQKIINEGKVKYFSQIEIFYYKLIFKLMGKVYCVDKNLSNQNFVSYINSQLKSLGIHGVINEQKIKYFINLFEEGLIKSSATILCNLKQLGEEEASTIGQIDLQQQSKQEACR